MSSLISETRRTVLHLVPTLAVGGGELQLLQNMQHFDHDRFEHIVAYIHSPTTLATEFERIGVRVVCIDSSGRSKYFSRVRTLRTVIRRNNVSLVHSTNAEADKLAAVAGFLTRTPVAATLNSVAYTDGWYKSIPGLNIWKLRYMKFSRKVALRLFIRRFNAVSQIAKKSFNTTIGLPEDKIEVIPRGVDVERFRPGPLAKKRPRTNGAFPIIITVGRLVGQKGQRHAIDAMPAILDQYPSAKLQIVGKGHMADALQRQVEELDLEGSVELMGYRSDIHDLLNAADVFVLPSLSEGCPNALLEAMAMGLPCVAAESDAAMEIITDESHGVLVPLSDSDAIARAVIALSDDWEWARRLGKNAVIRVCDGFTIKRATSALEEFYEAAMNGEASVP